MTEKEIFEGVLRRALDNGWLPTQFQAADIPYIDKTWRTIILTPEFAKHLWGWRPKDGESEWEHHLKKLVVSDNPVEYLGECLNDKRTS